MAAEKELAIAEGGGKKKKMMIIGGIAAVVLLGGGGAAFMMMGGDPPPTPAAETEAGAPAATAPAASAPSGNDPTIGTALYVPMPRPFVFNVAGASRDRLVQIKAQLLVRGQTAEETAKQHIPLIESTMLRSFSSANADDLVTAQGKDALRISVLKDIQEALRGVAGEPIVEEVLFTGFVLQ